MQDMEFHILKKKKVFFEAAGLIGSQKVFVSHAI